MVKECWMEIKTVRNKMFIASHLTGVHFKWSYRFDFLSWLLLNEFHLQKIICAVRKNFFITVFGLIHTFSSFFRLKKINKVIESSILLCKNFLFRK